MPNPDKVFIATKFGFRYREDSGEAKNANCSYFDGSPAQLALAWVLAQGEDIIPIPGTKKRKYLEENAGAVDVNLSKTDLAAIDELVARYPNTGERYNEGSMKLVNH